MLPTHFHGQPNLGGFHSIDALLGIRETMRGHFEGSDSRVRDLAQNVRCHNPQSGVGKLMLLVTLRFLSMILQ